MFFTYLNVPFFHHLHDTIKKIYNYMEEETSMTLKTDLGKNIFLPLIGLSIPFTLKNIFCIIIIR